jgi:hypothetical protein
VHAQIQTAPRLETPIDADVRPREDRGFAHSVTEHAAEINESCFTLVINTPHIGLHHHRASSSLQAVHVLDGQASLVAIVHGISARVEARHAHR